MERGEEADRHHREEERALHEAQRAGLEAAAILQVKAEPKQERTDEGDEGEGGARS
jgi:hypothetical protein